MICSSFPFPGRGPPQTGAVGRREGEGPLSSRDADGGEEGGVLPTGPCVQDGRRGEDTLRGWGRERSLLCGEGTVPTSTLLSGLNLVMERSRRLRDPGRGNKSSSQASQGVSHGKRQAGDEAESREPWRGGCGVRGPEGQAKLLHGKLPCPHST